MAQKVDTTKLQCSRLFSVEGWVCLITGGGTGIGLMCAQALATNGAKVYITGRRMNVLENAASSHSPSSGLGRIIPIGPCDVSSKADLEKLNKELAAKESGLHLLVCNAGISGPKADTSASDATELRDELWSKEDPEAWGAVFNTNVSSVYFTALAFLPLLQAVARGGDGKEAHQTSSIIVISSMSGIMRHAQGHFSYNAAKGATVHLARLMSAEFEKTGVRVNSIAPGYFPSELSAGKSDDKQKSQLQEDEVQSKPHPVPAGRAGSDEELAQACLFLAKNRYVNGEVIAVDGGVLNHV